MSLAEGPRVREPERQAERAERERETGKDVLKYHFFISSCLLTKKARYKREADEMQMDTSESNTQIRIAFVVSFSNPLPVVFFVFRPVPNEHGQPEQTEAVVVGSLCPRVSHVQILCGSTASK